MWGCPIAHSLSPVLHRAAYAALGLRDWSYDRREVDAAGFAAALAAPGRELARPVADDAAQGGRARGGRRGRRARRAATGAANTLVRRRRGGWHADNTDVHGITAALRPRPACTDAVPSVRRRRLGGHGAVGRRGAAPAPARAAGRRSWCADEAAPETLAQAAAPGSASSVARLGEWPDADVVISTVPAASVRPLDTLPRPTAERPAGAARRRLRRGPDAAPARRPATAGGPSPRGVDMLLHQADPQVTLMTGRARAARRDGRGAPYAVVDPVGGCGPLPRADDVGRRFPATPWWFVAVARRSPVAAVGEVLRRRLATGGYRLDDETGPPPRVPSSSSPSRWPCSGGCSPGASARCRSGRSHPAYLGFAFVAVALAWVDADVHRLPRGLTRPAYPLLVGAAGARLARVGGLGGAAAGGGRRRSCSGRSTSSLAVVAALLGSGFGLGDVTLAGLVGLATGYVSVTATLVASFAAFLLAGVYGVARIVLRRGTRKDDIAFGPWMLRRHAHRARRRGAPLF